jgi:hypothetical protein
VSTPEVLAALGIVLLSIGTGFALGFALCGQKGIVIPVPERPKLMRADCFTKEFLLNPLQILYIELGDGGPGSSTVHFIGDSTLQIDCPLNLLETD